MDDDLPTGVAPDLVAEAEQELIGDPTQWMEDFMLSQDEIDEMQDAEFLIESGAISSQVNIWASKAGTGKTSILMDEAANIVSAGYEVLYVNMDCGAADLKYWRKLANDGGFKMITPHFKGAGGIDQWMQRLAQMSQLNVDLSTTVIIVDTLKKIADLMSKAKARQAMSLLRALTAKQCTIICAAHCNKHLVDGKLVFEGVGDIENDCDNLVYLEGSERDEQGTKTVTLEPSDKVRGIFYKRSWQIRQDRTVIPLDVVVDVSGQREVQSQLEKDETAIEVIKDGIRAGNHKRVELFAYAKENSISKREFDTVIKRYCKGKTSAKVTPFWRDEKQKQDNASYYILLESAPRVTANLPTNQTNRFDRDGKGEKWTV
jgi:hypothetical protein